jgi:hypothetical protein
MLSHQDTEPPRKRKPAMNYFEFIAFVGIVAPLNISAKSGFFGIKVQLVLNFDF